MHDIRPIYDQNVIYDIFCRSRQHGERPGVFKIG